MNYFIDTEFHEYHKQQKCLGIKIGNPIPTIDLISIGIVSEDDKEYYAISKDFNIKDAWNSWQWNSTWKISKYGPELSYNDKIKEYWLRDNVLKPIFRELLFKDGNNDNIVVSKYYRYPTNSRGLNDMIVNEIEDTAFNLKNFTKLINKYGKTNKQIAEEIKDFILKGIGQKAIYENEVNFYAYYADYDWVVFAQLFGKMINLPKGFPMYCRDLKQTYDELNRPDLRSYPSYPKQTNEHNALSDAMWNKELYNFLNNL